LKVISGRSSARAGKIANSRTHRSILYRNIATPPSLSRDCTRLTRDWCRPSAVDSRGDLVQRRAVDWIAQPRIGWRRDVAVLVWTELVAEEGTVGVDRGERHLEPVDVGQRQLHMEVHRQVERVAPVVRSALQSVRIGQQAYAHRSGDSSHVGGD